LEEEDDVTVLRCVMEEEGTANALELEQIRSVLNRRYSLVSLLEREQLVLDGSTMMLIII
jgi:hypothetical protein